MKYIRPMILFLLLVMIFISIDLGINCLGALVPELQDGIPYNSFLQSAFGLLEDWGINTRVEFFHAFQKSLLITYALLLANVVFVFWKKK